MTEETVTGGAATDHVAFVRGLLAAAGMPASEEETAGLAAIYPSLRAAVDAFYAIPALRYVQPALHVQAEVRLVDWYDEADAAHDA